MMAAKAQKASGREPPLASGRGGDMPIGVRLPRDERRHQLVLAALSIFAEKNYRGATTAEIAGRAGISEAVIYQHFPSKKDLFLACLDAVAFHFGYNFLGRRMEHQDEPLQAIKEMGQFYFRSLREKPEYIKFLSQVLAEVEDPDIQARYRVILDMFHAALTRLIDRAQRKGILRDELDPEVAAWAFIGSYHTMYLIDKFDDRADLDEQYVERLINTILGL